VRQAADSLNERKRRADKGKGTATTRVDPKRSKTESNRNRSGRIPVRQNCNTCRRLGTSYTDINGQLRQMSHAPPCRDQAMHDNIVEILNNKGVDTNSDKFIFLQGKKLNDVAKLRQLWKNGQLSIQKVRRAPRPESSSQASSSGLPLTGTANVVTLAPYKNDQDDSINQIMTRVNTLEPDQQAAIAQQIKEFQESILAFNKDDETKSHGHKG
jgi:hypothetical protein